MAGVSNCYYCGYPLPAAAAVCPECGGAAKDFGPLRETHRVVTNAWMLLGLVLALPSLRGVVYFLQSLRVSPGSSSGLPFLFYIDIAGDWIGFPTGIAIIVWAVRAKRRSNSAPRFPVFLTLCVLSYLLVKGVFLLLAFLRWV